MNQISWVHLWFSQLIKAAAFHTEWIPLSASKSWLIKDGFIQHKTGYFFRIVGVRWHNQQGKLYCQPLLEQNEIGTLGFLTRETEGQKEVLVQAKIEPGNVGTVQFAPTCQTTNSNSLRIHGGKTPPFSNLFNNKDLEIISVTLQSEQGSRFIDKRNRNILATSSQKLRLPSTHRWLSIDTLLDLLSKDYLVNTDARSVLATSPWHTLVNRHPFSRFQSAFTTDLNHSYQQNVQANQFKQIKESIGSLRQKKQSVEIIPLDQLVDWQVTDTGISPVRKKPFHVWYIQVTAKNREVAKWDQPIIDSYTEGRVDLICGRIKGVLYVHFLAKPEPGLYNRVELNPTVCVEPGESEKTIDFATLPQAVVRLSVRQSDEGGRFYQDSILYRVIDIGEADLTLGGYWMSLAQIQALLLEDGWYTNEARSVLALLLYWL